MKIIHEIVTKFTTTGEQQTKNALDGVKEVSIETAEEIDKVGESSKKSGEEAKKSASRFGVFLKQLKRIAFYRVIRSALKAITNSFKEGIQNAYQYSKLFNGAFAQAMDSAATEALYLKNSLGAMLMPALTALIPIVNAAVDIFVDFLNIINQLTAIMTGASTWTKALKYPKEFAEETAGAAKEVRRALLGFDEINRLDAPNKGGSGSSLDFSSMFETVKTSHAGEFVLNFSDFVVKWDNLTAEDIAKKVVIGLNALAGAYIGFKLGGIGGAVIGATIGVALGAGITSLLFNNDGKLTGEGVAGLLAGTIGAIVGGFIGFKLGGVKGAAFGMTIGADLGVGLWSVLVSDEAKQKAGDFIDKIINAYKSAKEDWFAIRNKGNGLLFDISAWVAVQISKVDFKGWGEALREGAKQTFGTTMNLDYFSAEYDPYSLTTNKNKGALSNRAIGGPVRQGNLFIAGENGAELVSSNTAHVSNGGQITEAVASGNEGVINAILSMAQSIVSSIDSKDTSLSMDGVTFAHSINPYLTYEANRRGKSAVTIGAR